MKKSITAMFALGALSLFFLTAMAEQPGEKEKGPKKGPGDKKGWEPGKILPPHIRELLELTDDQAQKVDALEQEVRSKLLKIFTDEQKQALQKFNEKGPKGPKGPPKDKDGDYPPEKKGKGKDKNKDPDQSVQAQIDLAMPWFAILECSRCDEMQ
jgi:Spy/CpxP family protein refolding chaperone